MSEELKKHELVYRLVGLRIEFTREKMGMTQEELAGKIGLDRTSVSNIELGRQRVLLHTIKDISKALDVLPNEILKGVWAD